MKLHYSLLVKITVQMRLATSSPPAPKKPANAIFETLKDQTNELMLKNILEPLLQPLYGRISALEKQSEVKNAVIKQLQIQVDDLQQFSKRKSLGIDGITEENCEDAKQPVTQLVTQKMQASLSP